MGMASWMVLNMLMEVWQQDRQEYCAYHVHSWRSPAGCPGALLMPRTLCRVLCGWWLKSRKRRNSRISSG